MHTLVSFSEITLKRFYAAILALARPGNDVLPPTALLRRAQSLGCIPRVTAFHPSM
jgi:hypothetical protein